MSNYFLPHYPGVEYVQTQPARLEEEDSMTYACAHRLRRGNDIIGASGAQEWGLKEPELGVTLPSLECFFPAKNEKELQGTLDVWLFRTKKIPELPREEWIGTITITPDMPRRRDCWIEGQEHIMMFIHLDGHGSDEHNGQTA